jgi:hypothetical protein
MRATASARSTTRLLRTWPHDLGHCRAGSPAEGVGNADGAVRQPSARARQQAALKQHPGSNSQHPPSTPAGPPHLLVLQQNARESTCSIPSHRALHIHCVAIPRVAIADDCSSSGSSTRVAWGRGCQAGVVSQQAAAATRRRPFAAQTSTAHNKPIPPDEQHCHKAPAASAASPSHSPQPHALGRWAVASWQLRPVSTISAYDIRPVSGRPKRAAAVQKPLMKAKSKPARSMRRADRPSWQQGPCSGRAAAERREGRRSGGRPQAAAVEGVLAHPVPRPSPHQEDAGLGQQLSQGRSPVLRHCPSDHPAGGPDHARAALRNTG